MAAEIIDGKAVAAEMNAATADRAAAFAENAGRPPTLAVVLVGDDPASQVYVRMKIKRCEAVGIRSVSRRLAADAPEALVLGVVDALNVDPDVDGILVQLPLPDHIDADAVIAAIDPAKDVDGLTPVSAGRLVSGQAGLRPCTPTGCVILAERALETMAGKHCVVIGRSILVGKPAALLFLAKNATVTIAHSKTDDLPAMCRTADILVPAVGRPEMVRGDWVKPGACVIDVGTNRVPVDGGADGETKLVGDVAFDEAREVAGAITPSPGGVGPMTIACLLRNAVDAAAARAEA